MNNRNKIAFAIYLIVSFSTICLGLVYLFSPMFMPYHKEILGKNWDDLEKPNQMLLLALMKGMGAGLIGIGVLIIFLLFYPFRKGEKWVRFALPIAGLILYVILFLVTLDVKLKTSASTPWQLNLLNIILVLAAFVLSLNVRDTK